MLRNGKSLPQPRSESIIEELKDARELVLESTRRFCVSGNCQPDSYHPFLGKCVPSTSGKPNTEVFNAGEYQESGKSSRKFKKKWKPSTTTKPRIQSVGVTGQAALRLSVLAFVGLSPVLLNHLHQIRISN